MGWPMGGKEKKNKQKRVVKKKRPANTNPAHELIYRPQPGLAAFDPHAFCGDITLTITASRQWQLTALKVRSMIARAS